MKKSSDFADGFGLDTRYQSIHLLRIIVTSLVILYNLKPNILRECFSLFNFHSFHKKCNCYKRVRVFIFPSLFSKTSFGLFKMKSLKVFLSPKEKVRDGLNKFGI